MFLNYVFVYTLGCLQNIEIDSKHSICQVAKFAYTDINIFFIRNYQ